MISAVRYNLYGYVPVCILLLLLNLAEGFSGGHDTIWLDPGLTKINIKDNSHYGFRIRQSVGSLILQEVETAGGVFTRMEGTGHVSASEYGAPSLPVFSRLIEVPDGARVTYRVLYSKEETINLGDHGFTSPLLPHQPSLSKSERPDDRDFIYLTDKYSDDLFRGPGLVEVTDIGVMRGRRIARIMISPASYNPVRNEITVISDLEIGIDFADAGPPARSSRLAFASPLHETALSSKIFNYQEDRTKTWFSGGPVKYVILSDPMFEEALREFVEWKTRKGFDIIELYRGREGVGHTPEEMRSALADLYHSATAEDPAPVFLLIVGDHDQIPAFRSGGHYTDLYYAEYDGNDDFLPDLFYGRFSANNPEELVPQIEKTLLYEQYLFSQTDFLNNSVLIAGVDSRYAHIHGNGQLNYGTRYYFNENMGITASVYPVPHPGGVSREIIEVISSGAGFVNYTGHGFPNRWDNPRLSIDDIPELDNYGMYPLVIGNACETARFNLYECFGEALVRASDKGAVGYIGASNDTYWDEDYFWAVGVGSISADPFYEETGRGAYDRLFLTGDDTMSDWYVSQGQIQQAGNLAVAEGATITRTRYYWEVYHLLGDPSLMIYFSEPEALNPVYPDVVASDVTELAVMTEPMAYVALSGGGGLVDAGHAGKNGVAVLTVEGISDEFDYDLIMTRANRKPYIGSLKVAPAGQPFVSVRSFSVDDSNGNGNGIPEAGETIFIDIVLKNYGSMAADDLSMSLLADNEYIIPPIRHHDLPGIGAGDEVEIAGLFSFDILPSAPDGETLFFTLEINSGDTLAWVSHFAKDISAPDIDLHGLYYIGQLNKNSHGFLLAGGTATYSLEFVNTGSAAIYNARIMVEDNLNIVMITDDGYDYPYIGPGDTVRHHISVSAPEDIDYGSIVPLDFRVHSDRFEYSTVIRLFVNTIFENFEDQGIFKARPWKTCQDKGWYLTPESASGSYSIRSGNISHSDTSELKIRMKVSEAGKISFCKKISSERRYDFLEFYIDETRAGRWSGFSNWSDAVFEVEPGNRIFRWVYLKDSSVSKGYDAAWIDEVVFPPGEMVSFFEEEAITDLGPEDLLSPVSGEWISQGQPVILSVRNYGHLAVTSFDAGYILGNYDPVTETFSKHLEPGESATVTFSETVVLSAPGDYVLTVFTTHSSDTIPENDTLPVSISVPEVHDIALTGILQPQSGSDLGMSEKVELEFKNTGNIELTGFELGYTLDDSIQVKEMFDQIISPGETAAYIFEQGVNLSSQGKYQINAYLIINLDAKTIVDTLGVEIENIVTGVTFTDGEKNEIEVYPNPFISYLVVKTSRPGRHNLSVRIFSSSGHLLYRITDNGSDKIHINTGGFIPGIYYLEVTTAESVFTYRLLRL